MGLLLWRNGHFRYSPQDGTWEVIDQEMHRGFMLSSDV